MMQQKTQYRKCRRTAFSVLRPYGREYHYDHEQKNDQEGKTGTDAREHRHFLKLAQRVGHRRSSGR
ncbi:hypothetical protein [Actinoallomurus rhizosphaericola]|uniref:hypothetical protein n=1 Tax=Actinoallomurus rhizosphaericola TaxID=2952536 RepID=UPI0020908A42|nr:hypothetical protein [Actinoallomurus rhizosphaericola]MCO5992372.1 hypothetical protein [Actinoallomurus rhizosphaericola]